MIFASACLSERSRTRRAVGSCERSASLRGARQGSACRTWRYNIRRHGDAGTARSGMHRLPKTQTPSGCSHANRSRSPGQMCDPRPGLLRCRPRCRLYRPTGTGLPWLCCASAARARRGLRRLLRPRQNDRVSRRIKSQRSSDKPPWDNALLHRARVASAPRLQGRNHSLISRPVINACGSRHPAMTNAIKEIISTM